MKYLYELIDIYGSVVYVGETKHPKLRFRQHRGRKASQFYGRQLVMNIVDTYPTGKLAFAAQCELQREYGLVTDSEKYADNGRCNKK